MALIKCPDCGRNVSSSAPACPDCGRPIAGSKSAKSKLSEETGWRGLIIGAVMLVLVIGVMSRCGNDSSNSSAPSVSSEPPAKTDAECRTDIQCWSEKNKIEATVSCQQEIGHRSLHDIKWTDSMGDPVFSQLAWGDERHSSITYIGDKVEFQNGFGAFTPMTYYCTYDPASKQITSLNVVEGRLPPG